VIRCLSTLWDRGPVALLWRAVAKANDERDEAVEQAARLALQLEHVRAGRAQAVARAWELREALDRARRDFAELVGEWPVAEKHEGEL
jgi:hypothetical protein